MLSLQLPLLFPRSIQIDEFCPFMYKRETEVTKITEVELIPVEPEVQTLQSRLMKETFFAKSFDSLFWTLYLAHYGFNEYRRVANNGKVEVEEKTKIAQYIHSLHREARLKMSNYKLSNVFVTDILADLLTCPKMKLSGLIALSVYYKCNIYLVDTVQCLYLYFQYTDAMSDYVVYKNPEQGAIHYFVDVGCKIMSLEKIRESYVQLHHYEKPLKGISVYKQTELEAMAAKLGIEANKKQVLYDEIVMRCVWKTNV